MKTIQHIVEPSQLLKRSNIVAAHKMRHKLIEQIKTTCKDDVFVFP